MNHKLTRSILPTAVLFLLSALVLPGTGHAFATKDLSLTGLELSADDLPQGDLGGSTGDGQVISFTAPAQTALLPAVAAAFSSIPAIVPAFPHTVSHARAPPRSWIREPYQHFQH